jgi:hypothetical protein
VNADRSLAQRVALQDLLTILAFSQAQKIVGSIAVRLRFQVFPAIVNSDDYLDGPSAGSDVEAIGRGLNTPNRAVFGNFPACLLADVRNSFMRIVMVSAFVYAGYFVPTHVSLLPGYRFLQKPTLTWKPYKAVSG